MGTSSSPRRPCEHERDALRLGLELLALVLVSDSFTEGFEPVRGDCYGRLDFARRRLAPFALRFPSVGRVVHQLDWKAARGWLQDGRQIRRRLDVIAREIANAAKARS